MKKLLFLVILLVIFFGGYYYFQSDGGVEKIEVKIEEGVFRPDPSNVTLLFEEGAVTLSGGRHEARIPNSGLIEETALTDTITYGDINNDGKEDAVFVLTQTGGGSGVFIYLAGFVSGPVAHRGTNAIFLGDRIALKSLTIINGVITVDYLDRREEESMASEPTIPTTKQFVYRNNNIVER